MCGRSLPGCIGCCVQHPPGEKQLSGSQAAGQPSSLYRVKRCGLHRGSSPFQEDLFLSSRVEDWDPLALLAAGLIFVGCTSPANG